MSNRSDITINKFEELFRLRSLIDQIQWGSLVPATYYSDSESSRNDSFPMADKNFIEKTSKELANLGLDEEKLRKLFDKRLATINSGNSPPGDLNNYLQKQYGQMVQEIGEFPNSTSKAKKALLALIEERGAGWPDQLYDAMVYLKDKVSEESLEQVVDIWKKQQSNFREGTSETYLQDHYIFWASDVGQDIEDGIKRYKFRDSFNIGEFDSAFSEVETMVETALLEGSSGMRSTHETVGHDYRLASLGTDLWLTSRCEKLVNKLREAINIALQGMASLQHQEGWWVDTTIGKTASIKNIPKSSRNGSLASNFVTAICSLNLLKLSHSESQRAKGVQGVRWLLEKQKPNGSWTRQRVTSEEVIDEEDSLTTLLAAEAAARSDAEKYSYSLEKAVNWLKEDQLDIGFWELKPFSEPFSTVLVLEFLEEKDHFDNSFANGDYTESRIRNVTINVRDIEADNVAIGQNISQEKTIETSTIKNAVDDIKELSQQERDDLKNRVDDLEEEMQKKNPDGPTIKNILKQAKDKGNNSLVGLLANYLFQKFVAGV